MAKILAQVQDLENEGYEFEAAEASFDLLVKKAAGLYQPRFERLAYRVNIEAGPRRPARHRGDRQGARRRPGHAHGQRGRRPGQRPRRGLAQSALQRLIPDLAEMQLVDYKVRVVNARAGTAATGARRHRIARRRATSGARSASARTSSRQAGWRWWMRSSIKLFKDRMRT